VVEAGRVKVEAEGAVDVGVGVDFGDGSGALVIMACPSTSLAAVKEEWLGWISAPRWA
jgi:hypothetical protein